VFCGYFQEFVIYFIFIRSVETMAAYAPMATVLFVLTMIALPGIATRKHVSWGPKNDIYEYSSPLPLISGREHFYKVLNRTTFTAMAEIGVQAGMCANLLLAPMYF
jgi:hypothetical protein